MENFTNAQWDKIRREAGYHVFNEPWMENLNPELLVRYWRKKGSPGRLVLNNPFGHQVEIRSCPHGEMMTVIHKDAYDLIKL